jgi:hypothetical protein
VASFGQINAPGGQKPFREKVSGLPKASHRDGLDTVFLFVLQSFNSLFFCKNILACNWKPNYNHTFETKNFVLFFLLFLTFHPSTLLWLRPQATPGNFAAKKWMRKGR